MRGNRNEKFGFSSLIFPFFIFQVRKFLETYLTLIKILCIIFEKEEIFLRLASLKVLTMNRIVSIHSSFSKREYLHIATSFSFFKYFWLFSKKFIYRIFEKKIIKILPMKYNNYLTHFKIRNFRKSTILTKISTSRHILNFVSIVSGTSVCARKVHGVVGVRDEEGIHYVLW